MTTRNQGLERVHANMVHLRDVLPGLPSTFFDVRAWSALSHEDKQAINYSMFQSERRTPMGPNRSGNTWDRLQGLRDELEQGACSPALFIYRHLSYIDDFEDCRPGLGRARRVRRHMTHLLTSSDGTMHAQLIADGWGSLEKEQADRLRAAIERGD